MAYVISGLVGAGFASYVFLMIYFPEWVGITGKAGHKEGCVVDDSDPFSSPAKR